MIILKTRDELQSYRKTCLGPVGFVPTMGALHEGHASLLKRARESCSHVILSIFVNPTQFNDAKDLEKYPRTFEADSLLAQRLQVDAVYYPEMTDLYPQGYRYQIHESKDSLRLCGEHRPGHFDGVLTIVLKLFNLVQPHFAYFGEKDFQQLTLIRGMVDDFFLPIQIVACPTHREADGLAMSSRNQRLTSEQRKLAPEIFKTLTTKTNIEKARDHLESKGFIIDYLEDWNGRRLIAATLGDVRLIDNIASPGLDTL